MSGHLMDDSKIEAKDFKSIVWDWAMKTKWASLSGSGRLTFNSELLEKRRSLIDYVVLHELLHMKVPNHGKLFKSLMFAFLPDWEKCSNQLKEFL